MKTDEIAFYFAINDRPVKVLRRHDTGEEYALALDMSNGVDWVPADDYYDRYLRRDGDIDSYTEEQFNARVKEVRKDAARIMPNEDELSK